MKRTVGIVVIALVLTSGVFGLATRAFAGAGGEPEHIGLLGAARESITGDVYAEPSRWQPLTLGTLFSDGWDQAWASPPAGSGGAPRQGWIGASDGVFYRLGIGTYSYAENWADNDEQHLGSLTLYTPLSRRFELRQDIPFVVSNKAAGDSYHTDFGDYTVTPRVMLSESQNVTQSIGVAFRTPTGDDLNGNEVAAVIPGYEFWANAWRGLVVRGGAFMFAPYGHDSFADSGARNTFSGNLAAGYYFTEHDAAPFGDLVFSVGTTVNQATDDRGPATTTVLLTPAFRTHLGSNWYLLGGVDVPATQPEPYDYQLTGGLMKVF